MTFQTQERAENKQQKGCVLVVDATKPVCTYFGLRRTVNNVWPDELHGPEDPSLFAGQDFVSAATWFRLDQPCILGPQGQGPGLHLLN